MQRDSPFGRLYHETIHVVCLDLPERVLSFFLGCVSSDPDPEWCNRSVDSCCVAALGKAGNNLFSFGLMVISSYLDRITISPRGYRDRFRHCLFECCLRGYRWINDAWFRGV